MSKRKIGFGSRRDVNPQFMNSALLTQSGADTTTSLEIPLPVSRVPSATQSTIIEILKIWLSPTLLPAIASVTEVVDTLTVSISTVTGGTTAFAFNDSRVLCQLLNSQRGAFTAAGTYSRLGEGITMIDLTDGNGNGVLVASDSLFLQIVSTGTGVANSVSMKLLYRFKTVGFMEFVGIAQSQQ